MGPSTGASGSGSARSRRSSPTSTAPGRIFADGVVPRRLVTTSPHFHREVTGMNAAERRPGRHRPGVDLIRDENGEFRVLEDNVRIPSGVSAT